LPEEDEDDNELELLVELERDDEDDAKVISDEESEDELGGDEEAAEDELAREEDDDNADVLDMDVVLADVDDEEAMDSCQPEGTPPTTRTDLRGSPNNVTSCELDVVFENAT
jgi:hypothetical protein